MLNDERYRKITISRINDYLSKFNDLKKINFFKSISQIADIFKKYEDEIYKKNLTALYYEVITFLNEEINKSLISNYRLYETYKTLALIGVIIDFLLNKENNPVIKILLETYKDRENFIYQGLKYSYYFITKIDFLRIKLNALNGILINSLKLENIILLKDLSLEEYKNFYKLSTFLYENNITNPDKIFICVILKEILENIEILDDIDSLKERLDKIKKDININSKEILSNVISICKEKEDNNEPVIISTADGFQGDERDVIIYSLRYAPNSSPQIIRSLLSLNEFGENRLNVALTRARRKMVFFISRDIEEFPSSLLKDFLFYAKGFSISNIIDKEFDSDFERDVYERLIKKGYRLYPQYKDCGYRIDLALFIENLRIGDGWQHYDKDGELNIYDIERQEILERAGWIILRIPSTQYWKDPDGYIERLIEKINNIIENHKRKEQVEIEIDKDEKDEEITSFLEGEKIYKEDEYLEKNITNIETDVKTSLEKTFENFPNLFDKNSYRTWKKLAKWAKDNNRLSPRDRAFSYKIGDLIKKGYKLSDKQIKYAFRIFKIAVKYGFDPNE